MMRIGGAIALALAGVPAPAQDAVGFQAYLPELRAEAAAAGVSRRTLDAVFPTLTYSQRAVDLDRAQPGAGPNTPSPPYAPYRAKHLTAALIARGRVAWAANRARLQSIERQTGVPEGIMVSIWGNETSYGAVTGGFDLPSALATLAYEGRRRALFASEFVDALRIIDRGARAPGTLKGSWAGATGGPQFMPSAYLRLARDGDGDGRADIWNSEADTLASIANYFANAGWRPGQPWGLAVTLPAEFDRSQVRNRLVSPRCPRVFERHSGWRTIGEWRALGLAPRDAGWPGDAVLATLFEPDGPGGTAYLVTGNYRVILDYNCSNFYALTVGLLADAVAR